MAFIKYTYSVTNDVTSGKICSERLIQEINNAATIIVALDRIDTLDDVLDVWFKSELSINEKTLLDSLILDHSGEKLSFDSINLESESKISWTQLKAFYLANTACFLNYIDMGGSYFIWAVFHDNKFYIPNLVKNTTDATDFETNYKSKCNKQNDLSATGSLIVEPSIYTGPVGSKSISIVTPDLTDRTSWYQPSVQVVNEILTDSGDGLTFNSIHVWWVNIYGKLTYTHKQIPKRDGTFGKHADWAVVVKVNDVVQTSGYSVNYIEGKIIFESSKSGATVKVTYWHTEVTNYGEWLLVPPTGKKYIVEHVEIQLSVDVVMNSPCRMEIWAGANLATYGTFPDYLFEAGYGQMRADYRGMRDLINAANQGQGVISAADDMTKDVIIIPFNYIQAFTLDSAYGALFRMTTLNNIPSSGELLTATFYLQIRNN